MPLEIAGAFISTYWLCGVFGILYHRIYWRGWLLGTNVLPSILLVVQVIRSIP